LFDLVKLAFAVVAGIGGVVALVIAYRRQRLAEQAHRLAEDATHLPREPRQTPMRKPGAVAMVD
jgi:hypothetical protein